MKGTGAPTTRRTWSNAVTAGLLAAVSGCTTGTAVMTHDLQIVPPGDTPLESSTVVAVRALPALVCRLDNSAGMPSVYALHIGLPGAEPGQPIYAVNTQSVECAGRECVLVTHIRALPDGASWLNAQLTIRSCETIESATSWIGGPCGRGESASDSTVRRFVWGGHAWIEE